MLEIRSTGNKELDEAFSRLLLTGIIDDQEVLDLCKDDPESTDAEKELFAQAERDLFGTNEPEYKFTDTLIEYNGELI